MRFGFPVYIEPMQCFVICEKVQLILMIKILFSSVMGVKTKLLISTLKIYKHAVLIDELVMFT